MADWDRLCEYGHIHILCGCLLLPQEYISQIMSNLTDIRKGIFTSDCWRSFWIILIGVAVMVATVVASMRASVCSHFVFVLQYIVFLMLFVDL